MNFEALVFTWMEFLSITKGQRPNTVMHYEKIVRALFTWMKKAGRSADPGAVSRDDISDWIKSLFYDSGNVSPRTRASKLSAVRSFFSWLEYANLRRDDPTKGIPSPRVQETLPQKFSTEELRLLFAAPRRDKVQGLRDLAMLKTMYAAGPRVSELVKLDMKNIIDTDGYIRLILDGKGGKPRTVTMRSNPSRALREWLHVRRGIEAPDPAVFIRLKGPPTRLTDQSAQNVLKKYTRIVGIDDVDSFVHKMRATFACDLYDSGNDRCPHCRRPINYVGVVEVALLLGHEDLSTVMRYIGVTERVLRKTAIPDRRFNEIENEG